MKKNIFHISAMIFLIFIGFLRITNAEENIIPLIGKNQNVDFSEENAFLEENFIRGNFKISGVSAEKNAVNLTNVALNCDFHPCRISGKWHNEIIGEISFEKATFNETNQQFGGYIMTNMGNFPLTNIALKKSEIELKNKNFIANHATKIEILWTKNQHHYDLTISDEKGVIQKQIADKNIFKNIDFSLAGTYNLSISEKNNQWQNISTKTDSVVVSPGPNPEKLTEIKDDFYAKKFCEKFSQEKTKCPDGKVRKWSEIYFDKNLIADGMAKKFTIKLRDRYGNKIHSNKKITVKLKPKSHNEYLPLYFTFQKQFPANSPIDEHFSIIFYKPTDETIFDKIFFGTKDISEIFSENIFKNFSVSPLVQFSTKIPETFYKGKNASIAIFSEIKKPGMSLNPKFITKISTPIDVVFTPTNPDVCKRTDDAVTVLMEGKNSVTCTFRLKTGRKDQLTFTPTGTASKITGSITTSVSYDLLGKDIQYSLPVKNFEAIFEDDGKIVGSTSATESLGSVNISTTRANFWNEIRKNIAYLKRNAGDNFDNVNYKISENTNIELDRNIDKRSYIALGKDIIINEDIEGISPENPVALIAIGGNIIIKENVQIIQASLVTDGKIMNDGEQKRQLYIFGSVFASNDCMKNEPNCLPELRKNYNGKDFGADNDIAKKYKHAKIIVQKNHNLKLNPPPGLANFVE